MMVSNQSAFINGRWFNFMVLLPRTQHLFCLTHFATICHHSSYSSAPPSKFTRLYLFRRFEPFDSLFFERGLASFVPESTVFSGILHHDYYWHQMCLMSDPADEWLPSWPKNHHATRYVTEGRGVFQAFGHTFHDDNVCLELPQRTLRVRLLGKLLGIVLHFCTSWVIAWIKSWLSPPM